MLWIIGIKEHYETYGDVGYLRFIWPKIKSLMNLLEQQRDENGFLVGRKNDWIYIDWADFDKDGPLCAEQMFLIETLQCMADLSKVMNQNKKDEIPVVSESEMYWNEAEKLKEQVDRYFWDDEKQAYIDSYASGKRHVTRHANILAILYDIADEERKETLLQSVLLQPKEKIPAITTPYFRFFELDALGKMGQLDAVWKEMNTYWGGMLDLGALTFWEQYDPEKPLEQQYEMYGDPFGKSLCHAWAASPIYLLGRYFIGLKVYDGGNAYELNPHLEYFDHLECTLPAGKVNLHIKWDGETLQKEEIPVN